VDTGVTTLAALPQSRDALCCVPGRSWHEAARKLKDSEDAAARAAQKLQHSAEQQRFLDACNQQLQLDREAATKCACSLPAPRPGP
jgi:hypothetical protein